MECFVYVLGSWGRDALNDLPYLLGPEQLSHFCFCDCPKVNCQTEIQSGEREFCYLSDKAI